MRSQYPELSNQNWFNYNCAMDGSSVFDSQSFIPLKRRLTVPTCNTNVNLGDRIIHSRTSTTDPDVNCYQMDIDDAESSVAGRDLKVVLTKLDSQFGDRNKLEAEVYEDCIYKNNGNNLGCTFEDAGLSLSFYHYMWSGCADQSGNSALPHRVSVFYIAKLIHINILII